MLLWWLLRLRLRLRLLLTTGRLLRPHGLELLPKRHELGVCGGLLALLQLLLCDHL